MTDTEIRIKASVDPSVAAAAKEAANLMENSVPQRGTTDGVTTEKAAPSNIGTAKTQEVVNHAQVLLEKLCKLQDGLKSKSSETAKSLSSTVQQIEELSKSGNLNASVIAKMTAMYEDFIRNSVELPPDELAGLSKQITAAKTALENMIKTMTSTVPEIRVGVDDTGLKELDDVRVKVEKNPIEAEVDVKVKGTGEEKLNAIQGGIRRKSADITKKVQPVTAQIEQQAMAKKRLDDETASGEREGGKSAARGNIPIDAGMSKAQQAAQFQAQIMLEKLGKLQDGLKSKSSETAKSLSSTVQQIEELSKSGNLNASVIAKMTAMYEDFIRNSVELPPDELVDLSKQITAAKTALEKTMKVMASAVPEVNIKISDSGLKAVDELQHKLNAIEEVRGLDKGLLALEVAAQKTSEAVRKSIGAEIERIRELLSKPLDPKVGKQLEDRAKSIAAILSKADAKDTAKAGGAATSVIGSASRLSGVVNNSERIKEVWGEIAGRVGLRGGMNEGLAKMLGQSKALGNIAGKILTFFKGIGGLIIGAVTAAVMMVRKANQYKLEVVTKGQEEKLSGFKTQLDIIERKYARAIEMSERRARAIRTEIAAEQVRTSALRELGRAMDELDRTRTIRTYMTSGEQANQSRQLDELNRNRDVREAERQYENNKKEATIRLTETTERRDANVTRLEGYEKLRRAVMRARSMIPDLAVDEELSGVFDFKTYMKIAKRKLGNFFESTFGTEQDITAYAGALQDFRGTYQEFINSIGEKILESRDALDRQNTEVRAAKAEAKLYGRNGAKTTEMEFKKIAAEEQNRRAREEYEYEKETAGMQRHRQLAMRKLREEEADREMELIRKGETATYEEQKRIERANLERYERMLADEEIMLRDSKTANGKNLATAADEDMNDRDRWMRSEMEQRIEELKSMVRNAREKVRITERTGFDERAWDWESTQGKREERIAEEERQRTKSRNLRLGGPLAGQVEAAKEVEHWTKMAEAQTQELEQMLKKYRDKKTQQVDYRSLMANGADYGRFQQMQGWLDDYTRSKRNAEEDVQAQRDERAERAAQFKIDSLKQGNRLTRMGLGGSGADFSQQTASNTKELVLLTKEMLKHFSGNNTQMAKRRPTAITWSK